MRELGLFTNFNRELDIWKDLKQSLPRWREAEDNNIKCSFDMPGVGKEDIHVKRQGQSLHISAQKNADKENSYYLRRYSFTIPLPESISVDSIEGAYENGVLTLSAKKESTTPESPIKIK